jgi:metallo-beta-lactamase class B
VIGNIYYVGSRGISVYLITTAEGNILVNAGYEETVPLIKEGIRKLGFKYEDTKILLNSHAHADHFAGSARIIKDTGAHYEVMEGDVPMVESGEARGKRFPGAKVDRVLRDGDQVSLGGTVMTALLTPGHTKGCTTWTLKVQESSETLHVAIVGSAQVNPSYVLVDNKEYPSIAQDYEKTFRVLKALPVDVFLASHGAHYGMEDKYARMVAQGADGQNVFIDRAGYKAFVADRESVFAKELARQRAGGKPISDWRLGMPRETPLP